MAGKLVLSSVLFSFFFFFFIIVMMYLASPSTAATCDARCGSDGDCDGDLVCVGGKCGDDPQVGTTVCRGLAPGKTPPSNSNPAPSGGGGGGGSCEASGQLKCGKKTFDQFTCSPPVTSSTKATLSLNDFSKGGDGGSPSQCDEQFHDNKEPVVALSTGWYDGGSRCGKKIKITAKNGKTVVAKVVDQCDSVNGCDDEHAGLPPCTNDIVDGSAAVWRALGLNQDDGIVPVTWTEV